ncbi:MAG TPA: S53 family peptidase [Trebonia sp.]|nr:S53 family peptidase [Trebonia sp.]
MTRLRAVAVAGTASLLAIGGSLAATAASASVGPDNIRAAIADSQTSLATSKALQSAAPALPSRITASVYLASRNEAGLTAYAQEVSTPGTALYGHYLSAAQVIAAYAPSAAETSAVESWARSNGLSVASATTGFGAYVQVSGTPAQVQQAFSVKFGSYKTGSKKSVQKFWAPEQAASVPTTISGDVLAVSGLDSANHQMTPDDTLPPPEQNYEVAPYCSSYYGQLKATKVAGTNQAIPAVNGKAQPWTNCGYTPAQIRGAYNITKSGDTGKGVTVAVIDAYASPTMLTDANDYAKWVAAHGGNKSLDKPFAKGQYRQVLHPGASGYDLTADPSASNPSGCGAEGWYGEESLDVESVHGQAPNANVVYVGASDCTDAGLGNAIAYVVNTHAASIVTDSWGEPTDTSSLTPVYDLMFKAGAAEGIGFFFSAGDDGYSDPNYEEATDAVQADYPDSSPWVTSVGGTSLAISSKNSYEFETGWGTVLDPLTSTSAWTFNPRSHLGTADPLDTASFYDGSTGGGVSAVYTQPWYQKGVVPTALAKTEVKSTPVISGGTLEAYNESLTTAKTPMRVTPDVAALADPSTGFAVGETLFGPSDTASSLKFRISRIGGTSLASPTFAGIEADAQQALGHGRAIGFANPAIYHLDRTDKNAFHDVTDTVNGAQQYEVRSNYTNPDTGELPLLTYLRFLGVNGADGSLTVPVSSTASVTFNVASELTATRGYDDETGVGSPDQYVQAFSPRWP